MPTGVKMPERIDLNTITSRDVTNWSVICALADVNKDLVDLIVERKEGDFLEVCLTINGVELSFTTIMERLTRSARDWSYEQARLIIEDW